MYLLLALDIREQDPRSDEDGDEYADTYEPE
jgi:hypothetical protein